MRRRAGVGAVRGQAASAARYRSLGGNLQAEQLQQLGKQLEQFREHLEQFAAQHRNEIRRNAQFRRQFQQMCAAIGVDPLASAKGFWSVLGIGDFYYELGVQVVEVCLATSYKNGGLISLDELRTRLIAARGKGKQHQEITLEDLLAAVKKLRIFGNGFSIVPVGKGKWLVQSIPGELNMDHTALLQQASNSNCAHVSVGALKKELGWDETRSEKALHHMVKEGLAWIDEQGPDEKLFWFPSMFAACVTA